MEAKLLGGYNFPKCNFNYLFFVKVIIIQMSCSQEEGVEMQRASSIKANALNVSAICFVTAETFILPSRLKLNGEDHFRHYLKPVPLSAVSLMSVTIHSIYIRL